MKANNVFYDAIMKEYINDIQKYGLDSTVYSIATELIDLVGFYSEGMQATTTIIYNFLNAMDCYAYSMNYVTEIVNKVCIVAYQEYYDI